MKKLIFAFGVWGFIGCSDKPVGISGTLYNVGDTIRESYAIPYDVVVHTSFVLPDSCVSDWDISEVVCRYSERVH
jgi:hypothetical protein